MFTYRMTAEEKVKVIREEKEKIINEAIKACVQRNCGNFQLIKVIKWFFHVKQNIP